MRLAGQQVLEILLSLQVQLCDYKHAPSHLHHLYTSARDPTYKARILPTEPSLLPHSYYLITTWCNGPMLLFHSTGEDMALGAGVEPKSDLLSGAAASNVSSLLVHVPSGWPASSGAPGWLRLFKGYVGSRPRKPQECGCVA